MTDVEVAWLAGLLEGEGCFLVIGNGLPVIRLGMTDEDVVRRAYSVTGVGRFHGPYQPPRPSAKLMWQWTVARRSDVDSLLRMLLPLMGERRALRIAELLELAPTQAHARDRTHCPAGHAYDEANTGQRPNGWRSCKACARDRYHRRKAASQ